MREELRKLILVLMTGTRPEFKLAKKEIQKLWNGKTEQFKKHADVLFEYLPKFDQIEKKENKEAFISGINLFFLTLADEHFEILKNFVLKVTQNPDGHIREAMRHTADWLYISLSDRVKPFVYPKGKELSEKQKNEKVIAQKQYLNFIKEIEELMYKYDDGKEDVKYIDDMKPSVNKSLQLLWSRFTDTPVHRKLLEETMPISFDILVKRKEIEYELIKMLKKIKSDFDIEDIKDIIYNEEDSDDMMKVVAMFDRGEGFSKMSDILALVSNAWNYFPHKILDGKCPREMIQDMPLEKVQKLREGFMKNINKEIEKINDEDCDCEICKAMEKARKEGRELSEEELLKAFKKAEDKGGFVSGSMI